ncbi:hypothetical protein XBP1_160002 [Xenorhabdus bovienii str. puntauvense]|uniref:Uncharacterized protein n=1 Tax=Xenorhabdus bovienii str. puntauvense TaxID=1398201 RepID=A0A077NC37_XENBV|nr:hypothetical protein XBP1_160002 [Xenorhabdus bovienii str. puntauvense]
MKSEVVTFNSLILNWNYNRNNRNNLVLTTPQLVYRDSIGKVKKRLLQVVTGCYTPLKWENFPICGAGNKSRLGFGEIAAHASKRDGFQ